MDQIEIRLWSVHAEFGTYETDDGVSLSTFLLQINISLPHEYVLGNGGGRASNCSVINVDTQASVLFSKEMWVPSSIIGKER